MSPELFGGIVIKLAILVIILFNVILFRISRMRFMTISLIAVFLILQYCSIFGLNFVQLPPLIILQLCYALIFYY